MVTVEDRVSAGMEFLGKACPGWLAKIDADKIHVRDSTGTCPLSVASGMTYGQAMKHHHLSVGDSVNLGFNCRFVWMWEYPLLNAEWRRQITREQEILAKVKELLGV